MVAKEGSSAATAHIRLSFPAHISLAQNFGAKSATTLDGKNIDTSMNQDRQKGETDSWAYDIMLYHARNEVFPVTNILSSTDSHLDAVLVGSPRNTISP